MFSQESANHDPIFKYTTKNRKLVKYITCIKRTFSTHYPELVLLLKNLEKFHKSVEDILLFY